ncbi:hemerythrin domain-containing protein [Azotobacter chroococcum]
MSQALDALRHEHDAILSTLKILRCMAERALQGNADADDIAALLGFLQEFVDKCHHGKEEGLLFPALQRVDLAHQGELVGELTAEHEQGRALVGALRQASTPVLDAEAFAAAAEAYAVFLERHIDKENDVLFPRPSRRSARTSWKDWGRPSPTSSCRPSGRAGTKSCTTCYTAGRPRMPAEG